MCPVRVGPEVNGHKPVGTRDMVDPAHHTIERIKPDHWCPLSDVFRDMRTLKRVLFRLISEGKLRSREGANGAIEIWINDEDRASDAPSSFDAPLESESLFHPLGVFVDPLVSSYERNVQLARENGLLGEWVASLQRRVLNLEDAAHSDKRALEHAAARLRAFETANAHLTAEVAATREEQPHRQFTQQLLMRIGLIVRNPKTMR